MHGTPNDFRSGPVAYMAPELVGAKPPDTQPKAAARERFLEAMGPACAKLRLDARIRGEVCESPIADWPGAL